METRRQEDKETSRVCIDATPPLPLPPSPTPFFLPFLPFLASCFGLGYSPIMPGTCGALIGPLLYIPLALAIPSEPVQTSLIAALLILWSWITIALGRWAEEYYQRKDSQIFVTDEVAGFLFTVLLFHDPARPVLTTLWAFPVTRVIDILKIPPARRLEHLPRGWGVLADDLLGSVYAAIVLYLFWFTLEKIAGIDVLRSSIFAG
ncbi:MAG TPA: phosphatidylglycerophosphatase A [Pirellulaceae bacterium]|jgi:phosphatidylglycerophosphatase A